MLGGRDAIKAARRIMNNHVADMLGFRKTPGGTGWQCDVQQTVKFILQQCEHEGVRRTDIPEQLHFRITYDGAEVAGRPGLIVYIVPMNLGRAVESAACAYPIAFCQCAEKTDNLKAELADITSAIIKTRDQDGLEWGG